MTNQVIFFTRVLITKKFIVTPRILSCICVPSAQHLHIFCTRLCLRLHVPLHKRLHMVLHMVLHMAPAILLIIFFSSSFLNCAVNQHITRVNVKYNYGARYLHLAAPHIIILCEFRVWLIKIFLYIAVGCISDSESVLCKISLATGMTYWSAYL
jgi:hypothetical protein